MKMIHFVSLNRILAQGKKYVHIFKRSLLFSVLKTSQNQIISISDIFIANINAVIISLNIFSVFKGHFSSN